MNWVILMRMRIPGTRFKMRVPMWDLENPKRKFREQCKQCNYYKKPNCTANNKIYDFEGTSNRKCKDYNPKLKKLKKVVKLKHKEIVKS